MSKDNKKDFKINIIKTKKSWDLYKDSKKSQILYSLFFIQDLFQLAYFYFAA